MHRKWRYTEPRWPTKISSRTHIIYIQVANQINGLETLFLLCVILYSAIRTLMFTHVYIKNRDIDVVEQLRVILDRVTGGEEHHYLLLSVLLEESEEQKEPLLRRTHHIALHVHVHNHV